MPSYMLACRVEDAFATDGSSEYFLPFGSVVALGAVAGPFTVRAPCDFDVTGIMVRLGAAPGSGHSRTVYLNVGGSDVASVTISNTDTVGTWSGTTSITDGDEYYMHTSGSSGSTDPGVMSVAGIITTASGVGFPVVGSFHHATTATRNFVPNSRHALNTNTDAFTMIVMPVPGTLKNLRVRTNINVPAGSETVVSRLGASGATSASDGTLTASVSAGNSTADDSTNSDARTAGQQFTFRASGSSGALNDTVAFSCEFLPDTDGDGWLGGTSTSDEATNGATRYLELTAVVGNNYETTESNTYQALYACTLDLLYVRSAVAPATTETIDVDLRLNAADSGVVAQLTTANTASDTSNTATLVDEDVVNMAMTLSASPAVTSSRMTWAVRCVVDTGAAPTGSPWYYYAQQQAVCG